jgi:Fur family ferric uptake transcriptional regulator
MHHDIEKHCADLGVKMTEQRKTILRVIGEAQDHPNVEEIYTRSSALDHNISLATVYRTVNLLEGYGLIEKLDFMDGKSRYELKKLADHHHHLIDLESGAVIEFFDPELEKLKEQITKRLGYKLVDHRLELYGVPLKK